MFTEQIVSVILVSFRIC